MGLSQSMLAFAAAATFAACAAPSVTIEHARAQEIAPRDQPVAPAQVAAEPAAPPVVSDATRDRAAHRVQQRIARAGTPPDPYMITPSITRLDVLIGADATVACTIEVRVSPGSARGDERWEAGRTATAIGRAIVTSNASPLEVEHSVDACVDSAAEQAVTRRIMPFLSRSLAAR
jgi:hypothetical protein